MSVIGDNFARLNDQIAAVAMRSGRQPEEITLVAVSKRQPVSALLEAQAVGAAIFGENYVQEAAEKQQTVPGGQWHLLGHLQSNKAKHAVALFDLIQSVDSLKLARIIGGHAQALGKTQNILLQVHLGDEETKTGLPSIQALETAAEISSLPGIELRGLMGIAPYEGDPRPHFQELRRLFEELSLGNRQVLSMGMSGDFETAIEEGATMIRVGTALFGLRT
jgi:pyridoxal phosphate enzyme (YggS family)